MGTKKLKVRMVLFQKDFFNTKRRVFQATTLLNNNCIYYLSLNDVLEILEYDRYRSNSLQLTVTDGSEFVTIPLKGTTAISINVKFRIDPIITFNKREFISLRSINRLFNVDVKLSIIKKEVRINQPGRFFIALQGDTLRSIAKLLNTSVKQLLSKNKNLRQPIPPGTKIVIPTLDFDSPSQRTGKRSRSIQIKQNVELAPKIIALGRKLIGTPYQFGAAPYPQSKKFDCSSYTQYLFNRNGIFLPRTGVLQSRKGRALKIRNIEPGDLIFFRRDRYSDNRIGHVGIDIGNGRMLNTYKSPPGVTITTWRTPYWLRRYVTAREIL